ncbi:GSCFA domain-containing protein [Shewanella waksmanii]|uniref:GSCFA domain-containing protein n=1 Tax=Shewanella waksmanii TaxID=213783 RepID=UPI00373552D6
MNTDKYLAWWHEENHPNKKIDAASRLIDTDYLKLAHDPKFTLPRDANFFCIGSCFARNIEIILLNKGYKVLSTELEMPEAALVKTKSAAGLLTKFNTYSMLNEVEVALNLKKNVDNGLVEIGPEQFYDPQLHSVPYLSYHDAQATRRSVEGCFSKVAESDVCIITLGLTEMWWDDILNIPLNAGRPNWRKALKENRYSFRNPSFSEIKDNVSKLCEIITEHSSRDVKIILTVSPVPLQRTFSNKDIIVANSYSKSCLRTVANEVVEAYENVDYFPSFEKVMFSPRGKTWHEDQRHVSSEIVKEITEQFIELYMEK